MSRLLLLLPFCLSSLAPSSGSGTLRRRVECEHAQEPETGAFDRQVRRLLLHPSALLCIALVEPVYVALAAHCPARSLFSTGQRPFTAPTPSRAAHVVCVVFCFASSPVSRRHLERLEIENFDSVLVRVSSCQLSACLLPILKPILANGLARALFISATSSASFVFA